jgi:hypothetical protein
MNVKVTIKEQQITEFTYEVEGADSLLQAEEVAMRCHRTHFAPKPCHLDHIVPHPRSVKIGKVELS